MLLLICVSLVVDCCYISPHAESLQNHSRCDPHTSLDVNDLTQYSIFFCVVFDFDLFSHFPIASFKLLLVLIYLNHDCNEAVLGVLVTGNEKKMWGFFLIL